MQIPHWIQAEFVLSKGCMFFANAITSTPTWQYLEHSVHVMHLSFEMIFRRPYHLERI